MSETWKIEQGTKVRTIYGQDAELLTDWYNWEASVAVITSGGRVEKYHPTKVFVGGKPLPYQP